MHNDHTVFRDMQPCVKKIKTSNNSYMYSTHTGTVHIPTTVSNHRNRARSLELHHTLYVPDLSQPLFSIPAIAEQGYNTHIWPDGFVTCDRMPFVNNPFRNNAELVGKRDGNLFYIPSLSCANGKTNTPRAMTAATLSAERIANADDVTFNPVFHEDLPTSTSSKQDLSANVMHLRLGHLGKTNTKKMTHLHYDMKLPSSVHSGLCVGCCRGKQARTPFPKHSSSSYKVGEHVSIDVTFVGIMG
jgi:hypothetical protein